MVSNSDSTQQYQELGLKSGTIDPPHLTGRENMSSITVILSNFNDINFWITMESLEIDSIFGTLGHSVSDRSNTHNTRSSLIVSGMSVVEFGTAKSGKTAQIKFGLRVVSPMRRADGRTIRTQCQYR